jgi:hypothetical protein
MLMADTYMRFETTGLKRSQIARPSAASFNYMAAKPAVKNLFQAFI